MKKILIAAALVAPVMAAGAAYAGLKNDLADCGTTQDGGGYCYGTFRAFRNHADPATAAYFASGTNGFASFVANWNKRSFVCVPPAGNANLAKQFDRAYSARGYFVVQWNNQGVCTLLDLTNSSAYSEF